MIHLYSQMLSKITLNITVFICSFGTYFSSRMWMTLRPECLSRHECRHLWRIPTSLMASIQLPSPPFSSTSKTVTTGGRGRRNSTPIPISSKIHQLYNNKLMEFTFCFLTVILLRVNPQNQQFNIYFSRKILYPINKSFCPKTFLSTSVFLVHFS